MRSIASRPARERHSGAVGGIALPPRQHHNRSAELHPAVEVDNVLVGEAYAARRDGLANVFRLIGTMDTVQRILAIGIEIEGARTHGVLRATGHIRRQRPKALVLTGGWGPARPLRHAADLGDAGPALRLLSDSHAVADCLAVRLDQVEIATVGIDDDRSGRFPAMIIDDMALVRLGNSDLGVWRPGEQLLIVRLQRSGG